MELLLKHIPDDKMEDAFNMLSIDFVSCKFDIHVIHTFLSDERFRSRVPDGQFLFDKASEVSEKMIDFSNTFCSWLYHGRVDK